MQFDSFDNILQLECLNLIKHEMLRCIIIKLITYIFSLNYALNNMIKDLL